MRMMAAPAARAASNQKPSGKSVMRFDPGVNCHVPGGKKISWKDGVKALWYVFRFRFA